MRLDPISKSTRPRYPTHDGFHEAKRWLLRAAAVGAASVALLGTGCNGCGTESDPREEPCETTRLPGIAPPPDDVNQPRPESGDGGQGVAPDAGTPPHPPNRDADIIRPPGRMAMPIPPATNSGQAAGQGAVAPDPSTPTKGR